MKKTIKLLAVLAIISLLGMLFCGCDMLADMKENHAVLSSDKQTITFRGDKYMLLPEGGTPYVASNYESIYTTEEDVPVLLSDSFGLSTVYDPLRGLLRVGAFDYYDYDSIGVVVYDTSIENYNEYDYYCIEDSYDKYAEIVKANDADRIGFYDFEELYYTAVLGSATSEEIINHMTSPRGMTPEIYEEAMQNEADCIYELYRCDKEILLREGLYNYAFSITSTREVYFVNHTNGTAVKLSAASAEDITEEYFDY